MGGKDEASKLRDFVQKLDKALNLLSTFCDKSKSCFSENVSFLLDKALDHLKRLELEDTREQEGYDITHMTLIKSPTVKGFLFETLRASRAPVIHPPIVTFALKLVMQLSSTDERFRRMCSESPDVWSSIQQLTETTVVENSEIKQTFLGLFLSLAHFQSGQEWLWGSGVLLFAAECLSDRTVFTRKAAQELVTLVLPLMDDENRKTMMATLMGPITRASVKLEQHQIESDRLRPYFEVLEVYIEHCLTNDGSGQTGAHLSSTDIEQVLTLFVQNAENEKLLTRAGSLLVGVHAKCGAECNSERSNWEEKTLKLLHLVLRRGFIRAALSILSQGLFFWSRLHGGQDFRMQLVDLMIVPVMMDTEDVADHFPCYGTLLQFWRDLARGTTKSICDLLAAMLRKNSELNELTSITLAGIRKSMNKLDKDFALKITRSALYLLGCLKIPESRRVAQLSFNGQLAIHLTKSLCDFVDVYNIKWWESYETVCLPILFTKLVVYSASRDVQVTCAALQGLKFCIKQFLHPDQALLLNATPESTMNDAGEALQLCTVSVHWEVRDSAMEVVLEMARLSHDKYPAFQHLLIKTNLLRAAVSAFSDTEAYVRASAIAVVAAATPVPALWEHLTTQADIIASCYTILQHDSEALARRAAAKALTLIAQSGHFPAGRDRSVLHRQMSSAALLDLDWEVKLQALEFWQVAIDDSLAQQGMLDGRFPDCTFSKEKQKIIKLDSKEIRSRLQSAVAHLGSCGCLYVLLHLVDDCDAPVREKSIRMLQRFRDLLAEYQSLDLNLWPATTGQHQAASAPASTEVPSVDSVSSSTIRDSDQVIEEILSVDDMNLVAGIMTSNDPQLRPEPAPTPSLSAQEFISQVSQIELDGLLETTTMSSDLHVIDLDSLLDDLQDCIHTDPSRPRPDCY